MNWQWAFVNQQQWPTSSFGARQDRQWILNKCKNDVVACPTTMPFAEVVQMLRDAGKDLRQLPDQATWRLNLDHDWRLTLAEVPDERVVVAFVFESNHHPRNPNYTVAANAALAPGPRYTVQIL